MANFFAKQDIRELKQHTTPIATATMCFLTKPSTEYNEDGVYTVKVKLPVDEPATKKLLKIINDAAETAYKEVLDDAVTPKAKKEVKRAELSYKMEEDDEGNETGYVIINFKRNATRKDKNGNKCPFRLPIFDGVGEPFDVEEKEIWSGSLLKIAFKLVPYDQKIGVGVSHRIEAVQVIKLSSGGSNRTATDFGFKVESILEEQEEEENSGESTNMGNEEGDDY